MTFPVGKDLLAAAFTENESSSTCTFPPLYTEFNGTAERLGIHSTLAVTLFSRPGLIALNTRAA